MTGNRPRAGSIGVVLWDEPRGVVTLAQSS